MDSIQPSNMPGGKLDKLRFYELPVGDIKWIKKVLIYYQELKAEDPSFYSKHVPPFFMEVITPFYDCMWDGMTRDAGHVIYRLSDSVPKEVRESLAVYPNGETGSLMHDGGFWNSLEDWRREWEKMNPIIPEFQKLLPGEIQHLLKPPS